MPKQLVFRLSGSRASDGKTHGFRKNMVSPKNRQRRGKPEKTGETGERRDGEKRVLESRQLAVPAAGRHGQLLAGRLIAEYHLGGLDRYCLQRSGHGIYLRPAGAVFL